MSFYPVTAKLPFECFNGWVTCYSLPCFMRNLSATFLHVGWSSDYSPYNFINKISGDYFLAMGRLVVMGPKLHYTGHMKKELFSSLFSLTLNILLSAIQVISYPWKYFFRSYYHPQWGTFKHSPVTYTIQTSSKPNWQSQKPFI